MFFQHSTPYTTCTSPIMHHIYPPKFYITFVFYFFLVLHFGGQISCTMGDVKVEYKRHFFPQVCRIFFSEFNPPPPNPPPPPALSCMCIITLLVQGWLLGWLGITTMHMYKRTVLDKFFHGMFLERLCLK